MGAEVSTDPNRAASPTAEADFQTWLSQFRSRAIAQGINAATVDSAFQGLTFNPRVVELDREQPDDSRPSTVPKFSDYLARRLTPDRVKPGIDRFAEMGPVLSEVQAR